MKGLTSGRAVIVRPAVVRAVPMRAVAGLRCVGWAVLLTTCGCGPQLVEPGRERPPASQVPPAVGSLPVPAGAVSPPLSPPQQQPAELSDLPQVPAESVMPNSPQSQPARYHEVVSGDTLSSIARKYGTTVERLLNENGLQREDVLLPGQLIAIP